jgi:hypothetical protein
MFDSIYLLGLVTLTSVLAWLVARRRARLEAAALRPALVRVLEWVGLTVGFYVLDLLVGFVAVLVLRRLTGSFVSMYVNTDTTLVVLAALQAATFQWWRAGGES